MGNIVYRDYTKATEYRISEVDSDSKREDRIYRVEADDNAASGFSISCPDGDIWIPTRDMPVFIKMLQDFIR